MADGYKVYWQPGCTLCLRAKEFLKENGIAFESINVREDAGAMADLARLGAMSIPVITRGDEFAFAQEIRDLANFVGVELTRKRLSPTELAQKIDLILAAAQRFVRQIPADILAVNLPGRDRNCLDLAYHIFVIPTAFLDAARGGAVTFEHFERMPPSWTASRKSPPMARPCARISPNGGPPGKCPRRSTPITACSRLRV